MSLFSLVTLSVLALPAQDPKPDPEVEAFLSAWSESLRDMRTLRIRFTQTKHLKILRRPRTSSGMAVLRGQRLLMRVAGKDGTRETELLVDGDAVRIHYPTRKRMEIYPPDGTGRQQAPFPIFGNDVKRLSRDYRLELETKGDVELLVMKPKSEASPFAEVRIRFEKRRMVGVEQRDRRGNRVVLAITEFTVNPEVSDDDLRLEVPEDTKIVRFDGKREPGP